VAIKTNVDVFYLNVAWCGMSSLQLGSLAGKPDYLTQPKGPHSKSLDVWICMEHDHNQLLGRLTGLLRHAPTF
jgi:hypothetical protein